MSSKSTQRRKEKTMSSKSTQRRKAKPVSTKSTRKAKPVSAKSTRRKADDELSGLPPEIRRPRQRNYVGAIYADGDAWYIFSGTIRDCGWMRLVAVREPGLERRVNRLHLSWSTDERRFACDSCRAIAKDRFPELLGELENLCLDEF